jgi:hypothetical protein
MKKLFLATAIVCSMVVVATSFSNKKATPQQLSPFPNMYYSQDTVPKKDTIKKPDTTRIPPTPPVKE